MFAHSLEYQTVLFDPYMKPYQVLPLPVREDLGAMAIKGYSKLLKLQYHWGFNIRYLVSYTGHSLEGFYSSNEMQSVYSIALADWAASSKTQQANPTQKYYLEQSKIFNCIIVINLMI